MAKRFDKIYVTTTYSGFSSSKDTRIEKLITKHGGMVTGSGCGFGGRDINGLFKTARAVLSYKRAIGKATGLKRCRFFINNNRTYANMTLADLTARAREERAAGKA